MDELSLDVRITAIHPSEPRFHVYRDGCLRNRQIIEEWDGSIETSGQTCERGVGVLLHLRADTGVNRIPVDVFVRVVEMTRFLNKCWLVTTSE